MTFAAHMIQIGEEKGLRLPSAVLEQSQLSDRVIIEVTDRCLVIRPADCRQGWDEAFAEMARRGDDKLLDLGPPSAWDHTEWEW